MPRRTMPTAARIYAPTHADEDEHKDVDEDAALAKSETPLEALLEANAGASQAISQDADQTPSIFLFCTLVTVSAHCLSSKKHQYGVSSKAATRRCSAPPYTAWKNSSVKQITIPLTHNEARSASQQPCRQQCAPAISTESRLIGQLILKFKQLMQL